MILLCRGKEDYSGKVDYVEGGGDVCDAPLHLHVIYIDGEYLSDTHISGKVGHEGGGVSYWNTCR